MGKQVDVIKSPPFAPGYGVAATLMEGVRLIASEEVSYNETSPVKVFRVPKGTMVLGAIAEVTQVFNGTSPVVNLGDSGSATRFLNLSGTNVTTTGFRQQFAAFRYDSDSDVICTLTLSGATSGKIKFWLLVRTDIERQRQR